MAEKKRRVKWANRIRTLQTYVTYDPQAQEIWCWDKTKKKAELSAKRLNRSEREHLLAPLIVVRLRGTYAFPSGVRE